METNMFLSTVNPGYNQNSQAPPDDVETAVSNRDPIGASTRCIPALRVNHAMHLACASTWKRPRYIARAAKESA